MESRLFALPLVLVTATACAAVPQPEVAAPVMVVDLEPPKPDTREQPADESAEADPNEDEDALAANLGILGVLRDESGMSALGAGDPLSDGGFGGLGLSGGGGVGDGTGLGSIGTLGRGGGTGSGFGAGGVSQQGSLQTGTATTQGSLPPEVIRRVVRSRLSAIKYCYERQLPGDPKLEGTVVPLFVIGPDGSVVSVRIQTGLHKDVDACITKALSAMVFPAPTGGGVVVVSYPFIFKAASVEPPPP